jgi:hypothetical protein
MNSQSGYSHSGNRKARSRKPAQARSLPASDRRQGALLGVVITVLLALMLLLWSHQARAAVGDPEVTQGQVDETLAMAKAPREIFVGRWYGETPRTDGGTKRWVVDAFPDGVFRITFRFYEPDGSFREQIEVGEWGISGPVYFLSTKGWVDGDLFLKADTRLVVLRMDTPGALSEIRCATSSRRSSPRRCRSRYLRRAVRRAGGQRRHLHPLRQSRRGDGARHQPRRGDAGADRRPAAARRRSRRRARRRARENGPGEQRRTRAPRRRPRRRRRDERKIVNDAVAYIRGLAELRGRNADWAERAVREAAACRRARRWRGRDRPRRAR